MRYIQENVYGKSFAICYHRTNSKGLLNILKDQNFQPGNGGGSMYGEGFYFTYEEESQYTDHMEQFGRFMIKARVPLKGFLIFDKEIAQTVYGKDYKLKSQLFAIIGGKENYKVIYNEDDKTIPVEKILNRLDHTKGLYNFFFTRKDGMFDSHEIVNPEVSYDQDEPSIAIISSSTLESVLYVDIDKISSIHYSKNGLMYLDSEEFQPEEHEEITSGYAKRFYDKFKNKPWYKKLKGLMYTGASDGHCVVVYDYDDVIPLSALVPDMTDWSPKDNFKELIERVESIFTKDELKVLLSDNWEKFINNFMYEDNPKEPFKYGNVYIEPQRMMELNELFSYQSSTPEEICEIILLYNQMHYHQEIDLIFEHNPDIGSDSHAYYVSFVRKTIPAIEHFMDTDDYCVPHMIPQHWDPVDKETLRFFLKNGLIKK